MVDANFIPQKPFPEFKWQWATLTPTESINDPVVLLGVLSRMSKLEGKCSYSSEEFNEELQGLQDDIKDSVGVHLASRGGKRNLIRNSGQYWKALNLIPRDTHGMIRLTDYGRKIANHEISQTEFAALTVMTLKLPNTNIQSKSVCEKWKEAGLNIYPLKLILAVCRKTKWITNEELCRVVIPLSGIKGISIEDCADYLLLFREGKLDITQWPDCQTEANDKRMAREFLLFLNNYGYLVAKDGKNNYTSRFEYNHLLDNEMVAIISGIQVSSNLNDMLKLINQSDIISDIDRKRITAIRSRPHQARFRKEVLGACQRCVITNVTMPEVLEAAHIKPFKYHGENTTANGFAMRLDIHTLFDTGHLRIDVDGNVILSHRARLDYGATIPPRIVIPDFINKDFIQWRWDNYNGI